jgi:protein adenylyltransferase
MGLFFDNKFVSQLPGETEEDNRPRQVYGACWSPVTPTAVAHPTLVAYSREMAENLGLSEEDVSSHAWVEALAGNRLIDGMKSYSMCYGGHQFGGWAGQLGDGRAINLGEVVGPDKRRWALQLKGAGPTPYSRRADGRAVLRSSIREFICSEAMFHLGIPTTRALSLVKTGESVVRDMFYDGRPAPEPGAIVCRVSPSFIRFGNFEIFASRGEGAILRQLVEFVLERDYPEVVGEGEEKLLNLYKEVCTRTALMVSHWMRVGYVHGVMNTDNMSILGLTIDYGPYGWIDDYDPNWTPNTTDLPGRRYRFGRQPLVAQWNLLRLANALAPLFDDPQVLKAGLDLYTTEYEAQSTAQTYQKFGLPGEAQDETIMGRAYAMLEKTEVDMTLFFRALPELVEDSTPGHFDAAFYDAEKREADHELWREWIGDYVARVAELGEDPEQRRARMNSVNPLYVPRNYLLQEAIDLAESGDDSRVNELLDIFRRPYEEQVGKEHFAQRRPEWARDKPGCSMLSCSS